MDGFFIIIYYRILSGEYCLTARIRFYAGTYSWGGGQYKIPSGINPLRLHFRQH